MGVQMRCGMLLLAATILLCGPAPAAGIPFGGLLGGPARTAPDTAFAGQHDRLERAGRALSASAFDEAEALARQTVAETPDLAEGWHMLGLALANRDRRAEAIEALDAAAARYTRNAEPLVVKGDLLRLDGRTDLAAQAYEAALAVDPDSFAASEALGAMAIERDDLAEAAERYDRAIASAPSDRLDPVARRADLHLRAGEADRGIALLETFAARNPGDATARAVLGQTRRAGGDMPGAIADLTAARDADPESPAFALLLSDVQLAARDVDGARDTLLAARERFPEAPTILAELGRTLAAARDYEGSLEIYAEGLRAAPGDRALLKGASAVEYRLGHYDAAIEHAHALAFGPSGAPVDLLWLASVQEAAGRRAEATASYEAALAADDTLWLAQNNLAVLLMPDDPARALDLARAAADQAPEVPAVRDTLGLAQFRTGDLEGARATLSALMAEKETGSTALKLGLVLIGLSDEAEGRRYLERGLVLDPDAPLADEARAALEG